MTFFNTEEFGRKIADDPDRLIAYSQALHRNREIQSCVQAGLDPNLVAEVSPQVDPELRMELAVAALFVYLDSDRVKA